MQWVLNNRYVFWLVLFMPSIPLWWDFYEDQRYYAELMHESGVLSSQLLVISLLITPLQLLAHKLPIRINQSTQKLLRWLRQRRRYIGVFAFYYGLIHTLVYIRYTGDLQNVLLEMAEWDLALGWVAMVIFTALAITSNDYATARLGRRWKTLHRLSYVAAILTFVHWFVLDFFLWEVLTWFAPLLVLQFYRVFYSRRKRLITSFSN